LASGQNSEFSSDVADRARTSLESEPAELADSQLPDGSFKASESDQSGDIVATA
jgi:hypothetical protein